jgi:hypothetical protein
LNRLRQGALGLWLGSAALFAESPILPNFLLPNFSPRGNWRATPGDDEQYCFVISAGSRAFLDFNLGHPVALVSTSAGFRLH